MLLFSYLYIVVDHTIYQLIKVMKLKAYWLSQKPEILSRYHIETLSENATTFIQDIDGITPGTGTTGCTIEFITHSTTSSGIITIGIIILGIIAHLLDRRLNLKQELELKDAEDQDQDQELNLTYYLNQERKNIE